MLRRLRLLRKSPSTQALALRGKSMDQSDNLEISKQISVAKAIVSGASPAEAAALERWATGLLEIRQSNLTRRRKAIAAVKLTFKSKVIWPILKKSSSELKRVGWDERSWTSRLGLWAIIGTVVTFGNAGAGIAALGGAIGVPLWIVLGAGGSFAGLLIDEITKRKSI